MKKRELRRYLTEKYQRRQVRYIREVNREKEFDENRHRLTERAQKHMFVSWLTGTLFRLSENSQYWNGIGIENREIDNTELGRYRNHSFRDCGRPRCPVCGGPRNNPWHKKKDRLTIQEQMAEIQFEEELKEYYKETEK